jgi:hypothetical protein
MASKAKADHTTLVLLLMSVATFTVKEGYDHTWAADENPEYLHTPNPSTIIISWVTSCCQPLFHSFLLHALIKKIQCTHQSAFINNRGELGIHQESQSPTHNEEFVVLLLFYFHFYLEQHNNQQKPKMRGSRGK